ncbi:BglG family transcription antiterminator [Longirhabdus pacifica]|uniref:BglG family transcription antiterminator n=1 Tax=Longirhabdus pacifica TaxID=2305227 RepID=UPI0023EA62F2|nr:PRD domain-containing protein [Longirhabdus pacifica]
MGLVTIYISARERKIMELLVFKPEKTTVKELSKELDVSSRTVHRDLKGVEHILNQFGMRLDKKAGAGIKLIGETERKDKLQRYLLNISHNEYTQEERQMVILSSLLSTSEPIKLLSLANELDVTIATISNDLNKIEEQLHAFGLTLLRKRGYGVEIVGDESAKRKFMSKNINDNLNEFELISLIKDSMQTKITDANAIDNINNRLLGFVDKHKLFLIEKEINAIKDDLPYDIADSSYIGLIIHLALAIERIQQGEEITFDIDELNNLKQFKEFEVAQKMATALESALHIQVSQGELGYITMHLMGAKIRNDYEDFLEDSTLNIGVSIQHLIRIISEKLDYDLTNHASLFQGLVAHFKPAIHRIKQNMDISNPLLSKIKEEYDDLFHIIEEGISEAFPNLDVPEEEVGYLVMHFASALLNQHVSNEYKALVVCSSGIGTSKILSTRLEHEIPGLKTENISLFELDRIENYAYDIIVSTVPLKDFSEKYTLVSPLLSKMDLKQVLSSLMNEKSMVHKKAEYKGKENQVNGKSFLLQLEKMILYGVIIMDIMKGFKLFHLQKEMQLEDTLRDVCERLQEQGNVSDADKVFQSLLKREKMGALGIPGTTMALYHTRNNDVNVPSFHMITLLNPITVKAMDGSTIALETILLMLSPTEASEATLEVLSAISSLMIRDEKSIQTFQSGSEEAIYQYLVHELRTFFELKTNINIEES